MQEVAGSTPAFSTKKTAYRWVRRFFMHSSCVNHSPPLHVQHARVTLEAAEREEDGKGDEQRVLPKWNEDLCPFFGPADSIFGSRYDGQTHENREETIVFALQDIAQGEVHVRCRPPQVPGPEGGNADRPIQVGLTEFSAQESLLGEHDTLIVQPINQAADHYKPSVAHVNHNAQPHEVVAEVKGVANEAVHALRVEYFGNLTILSVAARSTARCVADGQRANVLAEEGDGDADPCRGRIKRLEVRVLFKSDDRRHEDVQQEGEKGAALEEPVASFLEFFNQRHVRTNACEWAAR